MNHAINILNNYLAAYWLVILFGLIHLAVVEHRAVWAWWQRYEAETKSKKTSNRKLLAEPISPSFRHRLIRRLVYVFGGTLLVLTAWPIVTWFLNMLDSAGPMVADNSVLNPSPFATFHQLQTYVSLIGAIGLITAGTCLTLSAGQKWLATTGKVFATLSLIVAAYVLIFGYFT